MKAYLDGMVPWDPTVQDLVRHPNTPVVHDAVVITEREKDRHLYYDWHGKWSDTRFRLVGQMSIAPQVQAGIALHRAKQSGRYEDREVEQLEFLYGHLERALTIGLRLGFVGSLQSGFAELLDRNPVAIFLVDEHKRLAYANRSATALSLRKDGVRLSSGGLVFDDKAGHDRLQGLISQALSSAQAAQALPAHVVRIPRPSGKKPYSVFVSKVSQQQSALSALKPAVYVIVTDPDDERRLPLQSAQAAFGLTRAEAQLAVILAGGADLRAAADELKVTYGTARTRLAQIYLKTARRQGELIRLLLTTLAL